MMIILRAILRAEDEQQDDVHPADYPPRGAPPPPFCAKIPLKFSRRGGAETRGRGVVAFPCALGGFPWAPWAWLSRRCWYERLVVCWRAVCAGAFSWRGNRVGVAARRRKPPQFRFFMEDV